MKYINIILLILLSFRAWSSETPSFHNVTLPRDMNATMVGCIEQDSTGLIWLGTNSGVFSYDGYSMTYHSQQVAGGHVYSMKDIPGDALYVGEEHGLWAYDYSESGFRSWLEGSPQDVRSIVLDEDNLWIGSSTGLYTFNLKQRTFSKIEGGSLGNEVIYSLIKASDGNVYIGTYNGLYYFDGQREHFRDIALPHLPHSDNVFVNVLLEDTERESIWIGTNGKLYRYGLKTNQFTDVSALDGNSVKSLSLDDENRLFIGTDNGLYIYDHYGQVRHVQHDAGHGSTSLINDVVWCVLSSEEGMTWLGTDEGISILDNNTDIPFVPITEITGSSRGNHFSQIYRDGQSRLWLGGSEGLICTTPELKGATWYIMDSPTERIEHNRIRRIYEDHEGDLWICTDGGVHFWTGKAWKHINLMDPSSGRNANWSYDIHEDDHGRIWVASFMGGLMMADKKKFVNSVGDVYADASLNLPGGKGLSPFQIARDDRDHLWVLYYNDGIRRINTSTLEIEDVQILSTELNGEQPNCVLVDSNHLLWLGLSGKILCIDGNTATSFRLDTSIGGAVNWLMEVDGTVWAGAGSEIWITEGDHIRCLDKLSGMADIAFYDDQTHTIYLGTNDGLYVGTPEMMLERSESKPIYLTGVSVNNHPLKKLNDNLTFAPDQRHIDFMVSDLSYVETQTIRYLYRLRGVDTNWYELPKGTNVITFNNLNYGSFILEVSRPGFSADDAAILSVPFVIRHPWYLTTWAFVIYTLLLIIFVLWCINFFRTRNRLKYEQKEKEQILEQIQLKKEFLTSLSKDLEGPLGNILSPVSTMLSRTTDGEMGLQMRHIQEEAQNLSAVISQIAVFGKPEEKKEETAGQPLSTSDERFLKEVNSSIEERISDGEFNVKSLCEKMGYGSKYVYRKLKQLTGKTPVDYIRSYRLEVAASLLKQKKFTVAEVMYMTGFSNASYFSKCFQAEYGCRPREYLNRE